MKKIATLLAVVFAVVAAFTYAKALDTGPDVISIDKIQEKKPPVEFKHREHQNRVNQDCKACHHTTEEGAQPQGCFECHKKEATGDVPDFKNALHTSCKDCHKKEAAAGKPAPTKCNECHPK